MKALGIFVGAVSASVFAVSLAFANPGMLPKHPGYPAAGKSPATGQATANDPGQGNTVDAAGASTFLDSASLNEVSDANRMRVKKSMGAGRLPEVEGPLNKVDVNPAGATSTKMQ